MSTRSIPDREDGRIIDDGWFNVILDALALDVVPRGTDGVATNLAGSLGSSVYRFLRAFIGEGHFSLGDYKLHHSFNGTVTAGQGWMLCDGRVINEANYDAEHGAGSWDTYIGSSPLDGKYLPNANDKFIVGAATTPQDGSAPITTVGQAGHQINLEHNHQWNKKNASTVSDQTYDQNGDPTNYINGDVKDISHYGVVAVTSTGAAVTETVSTDLYTDKAGSTTQSIKPESNAFQLYMRII